MLLHIDTDIGGDTDDLCALAMVLAWPDVEVSAVTTVAEVSGRRAGYARFALDLAARPDIPVFAGADVTGTPYRDEQVFPDEVRYWSESVTPRPGPYAAALDSLERSIEAGATIVTIGPLTNLALLERRKPGILRSARLVVMGGHIFPMRTGYPQWGNDYDYNLQVDAESAHLVLTSSRPTLVPATVTVETALRAADLPTLHRSGPLARLVARQAEAFAADERMAERIAPQYPRLPDDLVNFQHDALACAVALGWDGVDVRELPLAFTLEDAYVHERPDPSGTPTRVVTSVDGERFQRDWLRLVAGSSAA
ncbi:MAG: nucleoside hydrolase [Dehalococcoidia bacterium]|nr:MAG: nucleoside hydrolase [Dehalococcoidia bacterium]